MNPHFASLIAGLAHQASAALDGALPLGAAEAGATDARLVAQSLIDTLAALEEKTRGNLTADEMRMLSQVLASLRIRFATGQRG